MNPERLRFARLSANRRATHIEGARSAQPDLFAPPPEAPAERDPELLAYTPLTIQRIVEPFYGAERMPCSITAATVAEIRLDGLCKTLPEPEGSEIREAFFAELNRLYALEPYIPE